MENSAEHNYTYKKFTTDIIKIADWLKPLRVGYTPYEVEPWEPDLIVSINRGGLIAGVYLSHALNLPHYPLHYQTRDGDNKMLFHKPEGFDKNKNILLVDDINDSGKTFTRIIETWECNNIGVAPMKSRIKTAVLFSRYNSKYTVDFSARTLDNDNWIVFPWERVYNEKDNVDGIKQR
jgi:hypoxanthine phosphoribosyltransferase|tara:strand:+ start:585 stop:1118 length:534 start_codon:yes stop_codon:yes gene_type:complete